MMWNELGWGGFVQRNPMICTVACYCVCVSMYWLLKRENNKFVCVEKKRKKDKKKKAVMVLLVWLCLTCWDGRYGELSYSAKFLHHFCGLFLFFFFFLVFINKLTEYNVIYHMAYRVVGGENCQCFVTFLWSRMAGWPPCLLSATSISPSLSTNTIIINSPPSFSLF